MFSKGEFIKVYRPCIRMVFRDDAFLQNNSIEHIEMTHTLAEILRFYVPKYEKNGSFDRRSFNEQVEDPNVKPLTVGEGYLYAGLAI